MQVKGSSIPIDQAVWSGKFCKSVSSVETQRELAGPG